MNTASTEIRISPLLVNLIMIIIIVILQMDGNIALSGEDYLRRTSESINCRANISLSSYRHVIAVNNSVACQFRFIMPPPTHTTTLINQSTVIRVNQHGQAVMPCSLAIYTGDERALELYRHCNTNTTSIADTVDVVTVPPGVESIIIISGGNAVNFSVALQGYTGSRECSVDMKIPAIGVQGLRYQMFRSEESTQDRCILNITTPLPFNVSCPDSYLCNYLVLTPQGTEIIAKNANDRSAIGRRIYQTETNTTAPASLYSFPAPGTSMLLSIWNGTLTLPTTTSLPSTTTMTTVASTSSSTSDTVRVNATTLDSSAMLSSNRDGSGSSTTQAPDQDLKWYQKVGKWFENAWKSTVGWFRGLFG